jgi:hypothetical protein
MNVRENGVFPITTNHDNNYKNSYHKILSLYFQFSHYFLQLTK